MASKGSSNRPSEEAPFDDYTYIDPSLCKLKRLIRNFPDSELARGKTPEEIQATCLKVERRYQKVRKETHSHAQALLAVETDLRQIPDEPAHIQGMPLSRKKKKNVA